MENLDKKCRLCLKLCFKYQHLFRNHSGDTNAEKLYDVVNIQVEDNLSWPRIICSECILRIQKINMFKKDIVSNQSLIRVKGWQSGQCRLCLRLSLNDIPNLYLQQNSNRSYAQQINYWLRIELPDPGFLPRIICEHCQNFLIQLELFLNQITTNHKQLYQAINGELHEVVKSVNGDTQEVILKTCPPLEEDEESISRTPSPEPTVDHQTITPPKADPIQEITEITEESDLQDLIEYDVDDVDISELEPHLWTEEKSQEPSSTTGENPIEESCYLVPPTDDSWMDSDDSEGDTSTNIQPIDQTQSTGTEEIVTDSNNTPETVPAHSVLVQHAKTRTREELKLEAVMLEMKLFVCRICDLDTGTFYELREHVRSEHDPKVYDICCELRTTTPPWNLYDHIRFHMDKDAFKCKECGKRFQSSTCLRNHRQRCHPDEPAKHICELCGKSFWITNLYHSHLEDHKGIKFTCKYCGKESSTKQIHNNHIRLMHEKDNYTHLCEICGRGFPSNGLLSGHIADHGGPHGGNRRKKPKIKSSGHFDVNYFK